MIIISTTACTLSLCILYEIKQYFYPSSLENMTMFLLIIDLFIFNSNVYNNNQLILVGVNINHVINHSGP